MKTYILNGSNDISCTQACENLSGNISPGSYVLRLPPCSHLPEPEQYHADMRFCKISEDLLVCSPEDFKSDITRQLERRGIRVVSGVTDIKGPYPHNIAYTVLRAGSVSFHNTRYTDPRLKEFLCASSYSLLHVNQGYAGCSSVAVPVSAGGMLVISSDMGIVSAIKKADIPALYTEYFTDTDSILLEGLDHGFIGGCCGYDPDAGLLVCGKINGQFRKLSAVYGFDVVSVYDGPLTDIGGILIM